MPQAVRTFFVERPIFFRVCFGISFFVTICLFVVGFLVPPRGSIDGNTLKGGGILLAFAVVAMLPDIISSGKSATIKHGDTSLTISTADADNE